MGIRNTFNNLLSVVDTSADALNRTAKVLNKSIYSIELELDQHIEQRAKEIRNLINGGSETNTVDPTAKAEAPT